MSEVRARGREWLGLHAGLSGTELEPASSPRAEFYNGCRRTWARGRCGDLSGQTKRKLLMCGSSYLVPDGSYSSDAYSR